MDHRRTWRYRLRASPEQCVAKFQEAFTNGGGLLLRAKWSVLRSGNGATAVYKGRGGLAVIGTAFSQTAQSEEQGAIGSEVRFEIEDLSGERVVCAMWLAQRSTRLGFTSDARFFRPYLRAVEGRLRTLDAALEVEKS